MFKKEREFLVRANDMAEVIKSIKGVSGRGVKINVACCDFKKVEDAMSIKVELNKKDYYKTLESFMEKELNVLTIAKC